MKHYDAVIIGFGKAGKTLAKFLATKGEHVALIEASDMMFGGTCINVGCIPSKYLIEQSHLAKGRSFEEKTQLYREAVAKKRALTAMLRKKNFGMIDSLENADVIVGRASFKNSHVVEIHHNDGSVSEVEGDRIFINTGARPVMPTIPGLDSSRRVYISETLLDLDELPQRLFILGGGFIAIEFASLFASFGSQVNIILRSNKFLSTEEPEIAQAIRTRLEEMGVKFIEETVIEQIDSNETEDHLHLLHASSTKETVACDALLVAAGRRPNIDGLGLENAGVALTEKKAIAVDERLQTSVPHIWAMGDVAGSPQFTYISLDDYRIVRSSLYGDGHRTTKNRGAVSQCLFTTPPFARVGMTQKEAADAGFKTVTAVLPAAAIPKAHILEETHGLLKAVVDADTGMILGAHLMCAEAHEMIGIVKTAMDASLSYTALRDGIYAHPTMSESLNDLFGLIQ